MEWYLKHRLVKEGDGYSIEIVLNADSAEFGSEFMSNIKEKVLGLDDKIRALVSQKYADLKINYVKLIMGSMIVATIPFAASTKAEASVINVQETVMQGVGIVTANQLNMRTGPATTYSIMHVLWKGNQVKVIDESGDWYQVKLSDGRTGWVYRSYLQVSSIQQNIDKVIATAKSFVGTPYLYGGATPQAGGFDCSGLTQYSFKQSGYQLNRISVDQSKEGIPVSQLNLQPGDLLFYGFNGDGVVNHVGIYLGNGQMIHSPKTGDTVKITAINVAYWQSRFVTARRIIY